MKGFLIDTQALLWLRSGDEQLPSRVRELFVEERAPMFFSLTSVWEMAIKKSLKKLDLKTSLSSFVDSLSTLDIQLLEVKVEHLCKVEKLPWHHRDPFDRLLIAQAICEGLKMISSDTAFRDYPIEVVW